MCEGLHDEGVLGGIVHILHKAKVRKHAAKAAHVLGDVEAELLLEDEEGGGEDLDDVTE